jgi:phosphate transport system permease protein
MASEAMSPAPSPPAVVRPPRERISAWPLTDQICYWLCWATGIGLCLIAVGIVLFMLIKGIAYLRPSLLFQSPAPSLHQTQSGGFLDPMLGTIIVTAIGTAIAAPMGVAIAAWLSEYARPAALARAVESAIDTVAGVPSVVLALFGLIIFSQGFLSFLSQGAAVGSLGQSFFAAGIVMATLALPLIVAATREALAQLPDRLREASYSLGKTRATTIRHVLLPAIRPSIASGVVLGMGRIIGDTAIVTILLGVGYKLEPVGHVPILRTLRGTGSTLTTYVYNNSPAGDGNSHEKAYAAAFVLLIIVLVLNAIVTRLTRGGERATRGARPFGRGILARVSGGSWTR